MHLSPRVRCKSESQVVGQPCVFKAATPTTIQQNNVTRRNKRYTVALVRCCVKRLFFLVFQISSVFRCVGGVMFCGFCQRAAPEIVQHKPSVDSCCNARSEDVLDRGKDHDISWRNLGRAHASENPQSWNAPDTQGPPKKRAELPRYMFSFSMFPSTMRTVGRSRRTQCQRCGSYASRLVTS